MTRSVPRLLSEVKIPEGANTPVLNGELAGKLGASARLMMDEQSLFLAMMAEQLVRESGLVRGAGLSIYCSLEISERDAEVAGFFQSSTLSYAQIFDKEIAPMRSLRRMPVAQVFWSSRLVQAEGSVRVFTGSSSGVCLRQMQLDFADGVCDRALTMCCRFNPWEVWGQAWAAR